jgi:hypothetical protein
VTRQPFICFDPSEKLFRRIGKSDLKAGALKRGSLRLQISVLRERFVTEGDAANSDQQRDGVATTSVGEIRAVEQPSIQAYCVDEPLRPPTGTPSPSPAHDGHALVVLHTLAAPGELPPRAEDDARAAVAKAFRVTKTPTR